MKHLFLSMAAVAMLASCSSDEVLDKAQTPKSAIGFSTFVDKSTRAAQDINVTNIGEISVYGWRDDANIFDGTVVTIADNGNGSYTDTRYWEHNHTYTFESVFPKNTVKGVTFNAQKDGGDITFASDDETDLLYARTTRITPTTTTEALPSTPVNLIFSHLLSRVRFTFTNGFAANAVASLSVSNLTIKSVPISGTITPAKADAKWVTDTDADKKEDISFAQIRGITTNDDGKVKSTEHKYVIPTDGTGTYQVTFTVTLTQGSAATDYTFISTIPVAMVMGHSYDYAATISPDNIIQGGADLTPIEFTASVTPWKDWDDDDENDNDKIVPLPL